MVLIFRFKLKKGILFTQKQFLLIYAKFTIVNHWQQLLKTRSLAVSHCLWMCVNRIIRCCFFVIYRVCDPRNTRPVASVAKCPNSSNRSVLLVSDEMVFSWRETKFERSPFGHHISGVPELTSDLSYRVTFSKGNMLWLAYLCYVLIMLCEN